MNKRILIASVLKPVNDARNYEKTGISLAKAGYTVGLAGRKLSTSSVASHGIEFLPWFDFHRGQLKRLFAGLIFFFKAWRWNPGILIVTTWELLIPAFFLNVFRNIPVIYDVQENYFLNLKYSLVYPVWLRMPLAWYVRLIERFSNRWLKSHWLAERCYQEEISGLKNILILENKCRRPERLNRPAFKNTTYIYTGTISENYGIKKAIDFILKEKLNMPDLQLIIAGYAPQHSYYWELRDFYSGCGFIQWEGGDTLVPHTRICELIATAHAGIISYLPDPSTENCMPTKLYEYLGFGLNVILLSDNELWKKELVRSANISREEYYWENYEEELARAVASIK